MNAPADRVEAVAAERGARAAGVTKRFGAVVALDGVSFDVPPGSVTGLLGPNGAGKSTLLRIMTGLARPDAGEARILGLPSSEPRARARLGYLPEVVQFPEKVPLGEFLETAGRLHGMVPADARRRAAALAGRLGLGDALGRAANEFSKGMRRRAALAHALLADPQVLLLDEPSADLDPLGRRDLETLLAEERARGVAILLSSHLLLEMEPLTDRVVMLHHGKVLAEGALASLLPTRHLVEVALREFPPALREATAHLLPSFHPSEGRMTVATNDPELARELPRLLDAIGVRYEAVTMRRPNLRDLFFSLLEGSKP